MTPQLRLLCLNYNIFLALWCWRDPITHSLRNALHCFSSSYRALLFKIAHSPSENKFTAGNSKNLLFLFFFFFISITLLPISHILPITGKTCNLHILQLQHPASLNDDNLNKSTTPTKPFSHCHLWCLQWPWRGLETAGWFQGLKHVILDVNWPLVAVPERHWYDLRPTSYLPDPHRYLGYHRMLKMVICINTQVNEQTDVREPNRTVTASWRSFQTSTQ